jgi:hypothetical protein
MPSRTFGWIQDHRLQKIDNTSSSLLVTKRDVFVKYLYSMSTFKNSIGQYWANTSVKCWLKIYVRMDPDPDTDEFEILIWWSDLDTIF